MRTSTLSAAPLLLAVVVALAPASGAFAADYVPFLPDTTAFAPPYNGQAFHFVSAGQCLEVSPGNLDDEISFNGGFVPAVVMSHIFDRVIDVWSDMNKAQLLGTTRVAAVAAGWSYPDSLTVTFALVDTSAQGCYLHLSTATFADELPEFPGGDPQDTTAVQQVNAFMQFRSDHIQKTMQRTGSLGTSVETTTDPEARPVGTSIIDIFDVSDKRFATTCPPMSLVLRIRNTGTDGIVAYQFDTSSLLPLADLPGAVEEARAEVRGQWEELAQAIRDNFDAILAYYPGKIPCEGQGILRVSLHSDGASCTAGQENCVIYGDGSTLALPPGGGELPVANAGLDRTVECTSHSGTPVTLDGTGSSDPGGLPLTYAWSAPGIVFDDSSSATPTGPFPLGTTTATLIVSNGLFRTSDTVDITVEDTTPPEITVRLNRYMLWPPNHHMVTIRATVCLSDGCDDSPSAVLSSITSDEPDSGLGGGDRPNDIQDAEFGTLDTRFRLRSERQGSGDGRIYTIVYTAQDDAGNTATATALVRVPHDRCGGARPLAGYNGLGTEFEPGVAGYSIVIPASEDFDPRTIDVATVEVGNTLGIIENTLYRWSDLDGDQRDDLEVQFMVHPTRQLQAEVEELLPVPLGLHWCTTDGETYWVPDIFALGPPMEVATTGASDPSEAGLYQVRPNPTSGRAQISYAVTNPSGARVEIGVFNIAGQRVRGLLDSFLPAGRYEAVWDGRNDNGAIVPGGVYFYRVHLADRTLVRRMILAR
jgi:hypothetical protein